MVYSVSILSIPQDRLCTIKNLQDDQLQNNFKNLLIFFVFSRWQSLLQDVLHEALRSSDEIGIRHRPQDHRHVHHQKFRPEEKLSKVSLFAFFQSSASDC